MKCEIVVRPVLIHRWIKSPDDNLAHRLKKLSVCFVPKTDVELLPQPVCTIIIGKGNNDNQKSKLSL